MASLRRAIFAAAASIALGAGCSAPVLVDPELASRAYYAPPGSSVIIAMDEDGRVSRGETTIDAADVPREARTAIERERPGGEVLAAHRIDRTDGGPRGYRIEKRVLGEPIEFKVTEDGSILSR